MNQPCWYTHTRLKNEMGHIYITESMYTFIDSNLYGEAVFMWLLMFKKLFGVGICGEAADCTQLTPYLITLIDLL